MNAQNNMPVWMRAFYDWSDQMLTEWSKRTYCDPDEVGMDYCADETREFTEAMDWNVCHYCLGPCGDCKGKHQEYPYCDPCPRDMYGVSECTYCPIVMLKKLYRMRFREIE